MHSTHTRTHAHTHARTHARTHSIHTQPCTQSYKHVPTHTSTYPLMHTHIALTPTYPHTLPHNTQLYRHICVHNCTFTPTLLHPHKHSHYTHTTLTLHTYSRSHTRMHACMLAHPPTLTRVKSRLAGAPSKRLPTPTALLLSSTPDPAATETP